MKLIIQTSSSNIRSHKELILRDNNFIGTIVRLDFDKIEFEASHAFTFIKNIYLHTAMIALHNLDLINNKIEKWTATKELIRIHALYRLNISNKSE
jgi:hypothetical protein